MTPQRTVYAHKNDKQFQTEFRQAFTQHTRNISCGLFPAPPPPSALHYFSLFLPFYSALWRLSDSLSLSLGPLSLHSDFCLSLCLSAPWVLSLNAPLSTDSPPLSFDLSPFFCIMHSNPYVILDTIALPMCMKWPVSCMYISHWN